MVSPIITKKYIILGFCIGVPTLGSPTHASRFEGRANDAWWTDACPKPRCCQTLHGFQSKLYSVKGDYIGFRF